MNRSEAERQKASHPHMARVLDCLVVFILKLSSLSGNGRLGGACGDASNIAKIGTTRSSQSLAHRLNVKIATRGTEVEVEAEVVDAGGASERLSRGAQLDTLHASWVACGRAGFGSLARDW